MALLLFRFSIILITIGILSINGPKTVYSHNVTSKEEIGTNLVFTQELPRKAIVSNTIPLMLSCSINITTDFQNILNHIDEEDYDEEDDEYIANESENNQNHNDDYDDDYEDETDEDYEENRKVKHTIIKSTNIIKKIKHHQPIEIKYTWYRDGIEIENNTLDERYTFYKNGSLQIHYYKNVSGEYRCWAQLIGKKSAGLISKKCHVSLAVFATENIASTVNAIRGYPLLINCLISSNPLPTITWYHNKQQINLQILNSEQEKRYYILKNGSLLLTKVNDNDNGKYKCNALNSMFPNIQRTHEVNVNIIPQDSKNKKIGFFEDLQNETIVINENSVLKLLCIGYSNGIYWTFRSRFNDKESKILNKSLELEISNVTYMENDGFYTCHLGNLARVFNVYIISPPKFDVHIKSISSDSLSKIISLQCHASGYPPPKISWYRNGIPVNNNIRLHYDDPVLKIYTIDPEDEGLYQCYASNEAGEIYESAYVNIINTDDVSPGPQKVKCYPINQSTMLIKFDNNIQFPIVNCIIIKKSPSYTYHTEIGYPKDSSFIIEKHIEPFQPFHLILRGFTSQNSISIINNKEISYMKMSTLSSPVLCATQGLFVEFKFYQNGIFLFWSLAKIDMKKIKLQFRNDEPLNNPIVFAKDIIGTYISIEDQISFSEIENNLVKIPAESKNYSNYDNKTIIELEIPGNVTGILIPNTNKIIVRVLASIYYENEIIEQDLSYLEWNVLDNSTNGHLNFRIITVESRSVTLSWNYLALIEQKKSMCICYKNVNTENHSTLQNLAECIEIPNDAFEKTVSGLFPSSFYKFYMKDCNTEVGRLEQLKNTIDVRTKPDVPGPVYEHNITIDDGIILNWKAPIKVIGPLLHYSIEWNKNDERYSINVSSNTNSFKFPNVTTNDNINITIRAVGSTGLGIPIHVDLSKITNEYEKHNEKSYSDPMLGIAIGSIISIICICFCVVSIIKDRTCKKYEGNHNSNSLLPMEPNRNSPHVHLHEMQTLINGSTNNQIPNGYNKFKPIEIRQSINNKENSSNILEEIALDNVQNSDHLTYIPPEPDDNKCDNLELQTKTPNSNLNSLSSTINSNGIPFTPCTDETNLPLNSHSISTNSINCGNQNNIKNIQYLTNGNSTVIDKSHQKLLDTTIDKENNSQETYLQLQKNRISKLPSHFGWNNHQIPVVGPNG